MRLMIHKKEGVTPGAVDGEKPRVEESHKFIVTDRAGKGNRCIVGEGNGWGEPMDGESGRRAGPSSWHRRLEDWCLMRLLFPEQMCWHRRRQMLRAGI